jgi:peptide/nickel transport system permease protein
MFAAVRRGTFADRTTTAVALFFYSMPTFLLGEILVFVLFFRLHLLGIDWFPAAGYVAITQNPLQWARYLILPWLTIALVTAATYVRLTRGSMLDVMGEDYIRTARAKGLRERRVIWRHGVRSAITPVVTIFGLDVGVLLGGAVITETVFNIPGIGLLNYNAIEHSDFPIVQGTVLLAAFFIIVANILVDISYAYLDPRVRYS